MIKPNWPILKKIWSADSKSLEAGRAAYAEFFDVKAKDFDQQFRALIDKAMKDQKPVVGVPIELALAIALRSRGGPRGAKPKPAGSKARAEAMLNIAEDLWAAYCAENKARPKGQRMRRAEVKRKAAEDAHAWIGKSARISVETLLDRMGRRRENVFFPWEPLTQEEISEIRDRGSKSSNQPR